MFSSAQYVLHHTEHPDAYKKVTDKITIVQEAKKYEMK